VTSEHSVAQELVDESNALSGASVTAVEELAGDMSTRRFYRVVLAKAPVPTAIMMTLSGAPGPVGGGSRGLSQDDTYVEVGTFLRQHGVRVPHMYCDARSRGRLLVEDIGTLSLLDCAQDDARLSEVAFCKQGNDPLEALYTKALYFERSFAKLPKDEDVVVYQRQTSREQRATQIREFLEHYARPLGLGDNDATIVEALMAEVCERVARHPLQPSHFDFMASNIHILSNGELCLIDFQDMCLESPARDVVSLLNDRDSDSALGKERQRRLLSFFMQEINSHPNFPQMYDEYLLLWDFRVSGRFALLAEKQGIVRYKAWIPGTLRRLGRTLVRTKKVIPHAEEALAALSRFSSEIEQGRRDPWDFPS
jgi:aminoglycoside/choline kinase family phosphotransferase